MDLQQPSEWVAFWAGVLVLGIILIALSNWDPAARLIWVGLVIAILAVVLHNSDRFVQLAQFLSPAKPQQGSN